VPLELLEYDVFRQSGPILTVGGNEIDAGVVPAGQSWRLEHLAVALFFPPGAVYAPGFTNALVYPPLVGIYDVPQPGPTVVPCQVTALSLLTQDGGINGNFPLGEAAVETSWYDVDDDPGITLSPGNQLAVVFYTNQVGGPSGIAAVRAQFAVYQGTAGQPQPAAGVVPGPTIPVGI
jgi:hypothetical protein